MSDEEAGAPEKPENERERGMALDLFDEQASERVRRVWHDGRWFFSVIDVVGLLTDSVQPRYYWATLKKRLREEGAAQLLTNCQQLKMGAPDGKQRLTDSADAETLLRIIQSIPSPKAEPFKQWLARVGAERLEDLRSQRVAADSLRLLYRKRGYTDEWIEQRLQGITVRDELTTEWRERGADERREFAILTGILHTGAFDVSLDEHRAVKGLKKRDNLRDNMTSLELALTMLTEATSTAIHQARDSQGLMELQRDAGEAGAIAGATRLQIEERTGQPVVSEDNARTLTAKAEQQRLFGDGGNELE